LYAKIGFGITTMSVPCIFTEFTSLYMKLCTTEPSAKSMMLPVGVKPSNGTVGKLILRDVVLATLTELTAGIIAVGYA
jgi:hypothetical protein